MIRNGVALYESQPVKPMLNGKVRGTKASRGLAEAGYDIAIKQNILFVPGGAALFEGKGGAEFCRNYDRLYVDGVESRGRFCIASAIEEFTMPHDLVGIVHDKSTWAREGLSVFNTVIEPGWNGFLTLELVYHGSTVLEIPKGEGIAQVIFHEITSPAAYSGKYQNQEDRPVAAVFEQREAFHE